MALALLAALATLALPAAARGQDPDTRRDLEDFIHFTLIARPDLAAGRGQALLESGLSNAELAQAVDESGMNVKRFDEAIGRGLRVPELEPLAAEIARRVEYGRRDLARDPGRIDTAIKMLSGTQREKLLGAGRLKAAGEYAVPALLRVLVEGHQPREKLASKNMLREIGLAAVTPLCAALPAIDATSQQMVCDVLGDIAYPHAGPFLRELALNPATDGPVRDAAERAFHAVGAQDTDLSTLFNVLARAYYDGHSSLTPYPFEDTNNFWSYDPFVGLVGMPAPTVIFNEIMTMRNTTKALQFNPANRGALALFVAANLKRENELPGGATDPIYGESAYTPSFYATVFGTQVCLDVLGLGIDGHDTLLVRDAIAALAQTTGGANLFNSSAGREPLLEALSYPDRRVQYDAALTLARALPGRGFDGDFRVVPLLASAVRTAGEAFAIVVADDEEDRRQESADLEKLNYTIVGAESEVAALGGAIAESVGIDLCVVRLSSADAARQAIGDLRGYTRTAASPVMVLAAAVDAPVLRREYAGSARVMIHVPRGGARFRVALEELLNRAVGGRMDEAEAEGYAFDALAALEDIAIACSPAYLITDAELPLLEALDARSGRARLLVAGILARIDSERAQRRLFDAALAAGGSDQVDLLDRVAMSVKRFGNRAEPRHVNGLLALIRQSEGATAEAAARVHGALNLVGSDAVKLIQPRDGRNPAAMR